MHLSYHDAPGFSEPRVLRRLLDTAVAVSRTVAFVARRAALMPGLESLSVAGLKRSALHRLNDGWDSREGALTRSKGANSACPGSVLPGSALPGVAMRDCGYLQQDSQQEQLYRLERRLQLAYAIGDRPTIRRLETDLESLTGWRFRHHRLWLEQ